MERAVRAGVAVVLSMVSLASGWPALGAESARSQTAAQRQAQMGHRMRALEDRLAAVLMEGPKHEALSRGARQMLDLCRRSLDGGDPRAAEVEAGVAERLIAAAEGRPAQDSVGVLRRPGAQR
jgi:hypothetical protein